MSIGGQLGVWVPGENAPKPAFKATTVDALAILGLKPSERIAVTFDAGYRLDNSGRSVGAPERLSQADWLALGLSDSDAVLCGVGAQQSLDSFRWFVEANADVLVGSSAPPVQRSPLRLALGVSRELGRPSTRGSLVAQGLLSTRGPVNVNGALLPFEPRFALLFAVSQDFDLSVEEPRAAVAAPVSAAPVEPPAAVEVVAPVALPPGMLRVLVRDTDRGEAVAARIRVTDGQGLDVAAEQKPVARGGVEIELTPGAYEVEVSADGFATQRRRLSIDEQGVTVINIDLRPKGAR